MENKIIGAWIKLVFAAIIFMGIYQVLMSGLMYYQIMERLDGIENVCGK